MSTIQVGYRGPGYTRHFDDIFRKPKPTVNMDQRITILITPGEKWQQLAASGTADDAALVDEFLANIYDEIYAAQEQGRCTIEIHN